MSSKPAVVVSSIIALIQMGLGMMNLIVFGLCTIVCLFDADYRMKYGMGFFVVCLVFDLIGVAFIRCAGKRNKLAREFKKYVSVISTEPTDSIAKIADVTGRTMEEVTKNLDLMIKRNFFVNAHINYSEQTIVFGQGMVQNVQMAQNLGMTQMPRIEYVSVRCKYCAGVSEGIKGQHIKCKYCGMILK
ncbi:MAG: hypothetical protein IJX63_08690 [Lachnospiraceae bacterium]|nr:hypothetical protein [Lachnospiraceae bacterium]